MTLFLFLLLKFFSVKQLHMTPFIHPIRILYVLKLFASTTIKINYFFMLLKKLGIGLSLLALTVAMPASAQMQQDEQVLDQNQQNMSMQMFQANLSGQNEVPPVQSQMDGTAVFRMQNDQLMYQLMLSNPQNIIGAHIHCGESGQNGPIVVPLISGERNVQQSQGKVVVTGTITQQDIDQQADCDPRIQSVSDLVQAMENGRAYVNVHTQENPDGEIRGQISQAQMGDMGNMMGNQPFQVREIESPIEGTRTFVITVKTEVLNRLAQMLERMASFLQSPQTTQ